MEIGFEWSSDRPNLRGWYWVRGGSFRLPFIVQIASCFGDIVYWNQLDRDWVDLPDGCEWAGPIPEPK